MHILLVDNDLSKKRCGISTMSSTIANKMIGRGHRVTIYTQKTLRHNSLYILDPNVDLRFYNFSDNNLKIQKLRNELRSLDPDVCVPLFSDSRHLVWAVTLLGSGIPLLYSERHSPYTIENEWWSRKGRLAALCGADRIHLLLPSFAKSIPKFLQHIVRVVPNPAPKIKEHADSVGMRHGRKKLLWLGRLEESVKQCRLAISAFAMLSDKFPDWDMHVVGDGPDKKKVYAHAKSLNLGNQLILHGEVMDVFPFYLSAQLFCISSRTEGMPNALLEAQACGLPSVGFAYCDGVSDLITNGENGLLVEKMDAFSLSQALKQLMVDAAMRKKFGDDAQISAKKYDMDIFLDNWEKLLIETAAYKGHTVMDKFKDEPFASMARLSSVARREWIWRDFGNPIPGSIEAFFLNKVNILKKFLKHNSE
jgi:glycosyltransferase involved in cell wall biosynthesis